MAKGFDIKGTKVSTSGVERKGWLMNRRVSSIVGKEWGLNDLIRLILDFHDCGIYSRLPEIICRRHQVIKKILHANKKDYELLLYYTDKSSYLIARRNKNKIHKICSLLEISPEFLFSRLRLYIQTAKYSNSTFKPVPGFCPERYAELLKKDKATAFFDYLKNDFPEGPWKMKVLKKNCSQGFAPNNLKSALHVHLHYVDDLEEILKRIQSSKNTPDLFFSVTSEEAFNIVEEKTKPLKQFKTKIALFPNAGRNIGPLLTGYAEELSRYDLIGHIHSKKSPHLDNRGFLNSWKDFLFNNIIGGEEPMIDFIINEFSANPSAGIIFPDDPIVYGWGDNRSQAEEILRAMKIVAPELKQDYISFPVGMMFWARREAIQPLFDLKLSWNDYPKEPLDTDGTILHAIERVLGIVSSAQGYDAVVTKENFYDREMPA
jgi:hypothetical protein